MDDSKMKETMMKIPIKKSSKKDRHSKIITSGGLRDRRMRLSLEVAPKFFGLQEMLGFDKASQTLEWLLSKSQWAITELSRDGCGAPGGGNGDGGGGGGVDANTTSNCEIISSGVLETNERVQKRENEKTFSCPKKKKKKAKVARVYPPFTKISREKARERARERTSAKNKFLSESPSTRMLESSFTG